MNEGETPLSADGSVIDSSETSAVARLEAAGWLPDPSGGFAATIGPLWVRHEEGAVVFGVLAGPAHLNPKGFVHGGMIAGFLDHAMGVATRREGIGPRATVQLNTHFLDGAREGDFLEVRCEIVRQTRVLQFLRAIVTVGDRTVAMADGVWKIVGAR